MVSTPIASDHRWAIPAADVHDRETGVEEQTHRDGAGHRYRFGPLLEDVALALLVVLMCPVVIVIVGTPVVLVAADRDRRADRMTFRHQDSQSASLA